MTLSTEKIDGLCKIRIEGDMTIFNANDLKKDLMEIVDECPELEVDLSRVSEVDTSGLQLLILAKRESKSLNKAFRVVSYSPGILNVMELFNIKDYFN